MAKVARATRPMIRLFFKILSIVVKFWFLVYMDLGGKDISGIIGTSPIFRDCALFSLIFPIIPYYSPQKKAHPIG